MKKLGIALLIVVACLFVFKKTHLGSYLQTAWGNLKDGAKRQVPIEFEIDRIRTQIVKLDDDMRGQLSPIAEEMATVKTLRKRIQVTRDNLRKEKDNLLAMTRDLKKGEEFVTYDGDEYSAEEVK